MPSNHHFSLFLILPPLLNTNILVFAILTSKPHFLQYFDSTFNIFCIRDTVSVPEAISSAYININIFRFYSSTYTPWQPSFFIISTSSLIYNVKRKGLNIHPCRVPTVHWKYSVNPERVLTQDFKFEYIEFKTFNNFPWTPDLINLYHSRLWGMVSKALVKSMKRT